MSEKRLVYSSDSGRVIQEPRQSGKQGKRQPGKAPPNLPNDGVVRLFREKGGRGGKTVTVIRGLPEQGAALEARLGELKRLCGAGGTLRDGAIEIQGRSPRPDSRTPDGTRLQGKAGGRVRDQRFWLTDAALIRMHQLHNDGRGQAH